MSAPNPVLYEEGSTTPLAPFDFGTVPGGTTSVVWEFDLANVGATAEEMTEVSLGILESDDSGATWHQNGALTLNRLVLMQAYGVDGDDIEPQVTQYTPVGAGARLLLKPIPAETRRKLRMEVALPGGVSSFVKQIKVTVDWRVAYTALSQGFFEGGVRGFCGGTGDPQASFLMAGGTFAESGTPDDEVQLEDVLVYKYKGVPHVVYPGSAVGAIAASASGQARWAALIGGAAGLDTEESSEVADPAPLSDRPAAPDSEPVFAYVHRDDDAAIIDADIYYPTARAPQPFGYRSLGGLDIDIGGGNGIVDNRLVHRDKDQSVSLEPSVENIIYVLPDGSVQRVDAGDTPSADRAEPAWSLTTDGSGITAVRDLRRLLGADVRSFDAFFPGAATVGDAGYWVVPPGRRAYVLVPQGAEMSVGDIGDHTSGDLVADLQWWDGAAWQSAFSDAARRPTMAFDATVLNLAGFLPDTVAFDGGTRLRWRINTLPTGGSTDPSDVYLRADLELVSL